MPRQLTSHVAGLEIENATFNRTFGGHQYDYDGPLAKEKKALEELKDVRGSVVELSRHAELFRTKVPTYNDRFKTDLRNAFAPFSM